MTNETKSPAQAAPVVAASELSNERAAFEAWWDKFTDEHADWPYADASALRWAAFQAGASLAAPAAVDRLLVEIAGLASLGSSYGLTADGYCHQIHEIATRARAVLAAATPAASEPQQYRTGYGDGVRAAAKLCDAKYAARVASGHPREASTARALAEEIRNLQSAALAAPAAQQPVMPRELTNAQREAVCEAVAEALDNAMDCTRVWSAWGYGTMREDDFVSVAGDAGRVAEIADAAIAALLAAAPSPAVQQPAEGGWIANTGVQPVADDVRVEVIMRDGYCVTRTANRYAWRIDGQGDDIVRWRPAAPTQAEGA